MRRGSHVEVNGYGEPVCTVCGQPVTYVHYASEQCPGYICDSPRRKCWEKFRLRGPWPWRYNPQTDTWECWVNTIWICPNKKPQGAKILQDHVYLTQGWEDTGWHLEEGF